MNEIWIFGNENVEEDSLPLRLMPGLNKRLPGVQFILKDPNEEWDALPNPFIIIDTVRGIKEVTVFTDLDQFVSTPQVTVHDFDLGMKLRWLQKLGKLPPFKIIGIPFNCTPQLAIAQITSILGEYL